MSTHAKLSPSAAHRWLHCAGSVVLEAQCPEGSSDFADEGTAAHSLASMALESRQHARAYLGRLIEVNGKQWEVTEEMAGYVQEYLDYVRALGGQLLIEQRLSIEHLTGEPEAKGTSDAVVLLDDELIIVDLKYGRGVKVDAEHNEQLALYALAALKEFEFLAEFKRVRLVVSQPRLNHLDEWDCAVADLQRFAEQEVKRGAERCQSAVTYFETHSELHEKYLTPGNDQCLFCAAKARCPALTKHVLQTVADDFVDVAQPINKQLDRAGVPVTSRAVDNATLGNLLASMDLIETFCKAVRAEAERELLAGRAVPGFKLVEGRRGARKWADETEVETTLKGMRLKTEEMYDFSLISPTSAEKLHKSGVIGPRQWPKLQSLITQSEGKPSVAPESDKRPALVMTAVENDFEALV